MKNIMSIMQEVGKLQEKIKKTQEEIENLKISATSGGEMVKIIINGKGDIIELEINDDIINVDDKDMMQDLIIAAFNNANTKLNEEKANMMKNSTGNIPLPPGFNFPF